MSIVDVIGAGNLSALVVVVAIPFLIKLAPRLRLVDRPGGRKRHFGEVALVGGLAIYASLVAIALLFQQGSAQQAQVFLVLAGAATIAGLIDDLYGLRPVAKLALQFGVAGLAIACGGPAIHRLGDLAGLGDPSLGWAAPAVTVVGYVVVMNAVNLIDGSDGVAGAVAAVMLVALIALAPVGSAAAMWLAAALGAIAGFLVYNMPWPHRPRPRVFLGDAGSMLVGFTLAWSAFNVHDAEPQLHPITLAWIFAVPIIDMGAVAASRLARGISPFTPGRDHLHHLMMDRGLSALATALTIAAAALLFAAIGIVASRLGASDRLLFAMLIAAAVGYAALTHRLRVGGALSKGWARALPAGLPKVRWGTVAPARAAREPARHSRGAPAA